MNPRQIYSRSLPDNLILEADVSLCVFTYPGYPLQLRVRLRNRRDCPDAARDLGTAYLVDKTKTATTTTEADVHALLATVGTTACTRCQGPAFDPATIETNRNGLCERCFMTDLNARFDKEVAKEEKQARAYDRKMKKQGMTHKVAAWVHPETGGDDYRIDFYMTLKPTAAQVKAQLRKQGSAVLDDYTIIVL